MFVIYGALLGFSQIIIFEKLKKETASVVYLVFVLLSPALLLAEKYFSGFSYQIFKTDFVLQVIFVVVLFTTGVYWLTKLVKENKEELPVLKYEGLALLLFILSFQDAKIFTLILWSSFVGFKFEEKVVAKTKYLLILMLVLTFVLKANVWIGFCLIIWCLVLGKLFLEKITAEDHYVLLLILSLLQVGKIISAELTIAFGLVIILSFFRFKLTSNDLSKINGWLKSNVIYNKFTKWSVQSKLSSIKLPYYTHDFLAPSRPTQRISLLVKKREYVLTMIFALLGFMSLLILLMEEFWF